MKPKKRPRRRSHASFTSDLEHSDIFSVRFFFYVHVFCGMPFNEKTNCLLKKSEICSLMFFQLLECKQSQMKTATTMAPNKRLHMRARFHFFAHLFAFVCKKATKWESEVQGF